MIVDSKENSPQKHKSKKILAAQHYDTGQQVFTTFGSAGVHF